MGSTASSSCTVADAEQDHRRHNFPECEAGASDQLLGEVELGLRHG